jgi:hypothetical protein
MSDQSSHSFQAFVEESDQPLPLFQVLIEEYMGQRRARAGQQDQYQMPEYAADDLKRQLLAYKALADDDARKKFNSEKVGQFYKWLHTNGVRRSALCFSGGGIRSATYGLGILQGLAGHQLLEKFDYLSTVSGGGYLGSWLSAWIHRKGLKKVQERLDNPPPPSSPLQPEPEAVKHLRAYSNYMSPKLGLLSADTWTLVAIFFRNLLLNWLVLIPLIMIALMVPRLAVVAARYDASGPLKLTFFLLAVAGGILAIIYIYANRPSLADDYLRDDAGAGSIFPNEKKGQGWFLIRCLVPQLVLAVCITTFYAWQHRKFDDLDFSWAFNALGINWLSGSIQVIIAFISFGVVLHLGAWALSYFYVRRFIWTEPFVAIIAGGLGGLFTYLLAEKAFPDTNFNAMPGMDGAHAVALYVCFAVPLFLLVFLLAATLFVGLSSKYTSDADREWLARFGAWLLIASVAWSVTSALVIFGPVLLLVGTWRTMTTLSLGTISGIITLVLGRSSQTSAKDKGADEAGSTGGLSELALTLAAPLFLAFILICLSLLTSWVITQLITLFTPPTSFFAQYFAFINAPGLQNILYHSPVRLLLLLTLMLGIVAYFASRFININKFSLHAAYRDRLIRAYMGASRNEQERKPNPFTGLDENDDIQVQQLRTQLFHENNTDLEEMVRELKLQQDMVPRRVGSGTILSGKEVSRYILSRLSQKAKDLIKDQPNKVPVKQDARRFALLDDLNRIIQGESIYDVFRFVSVPLTAEIEDLLKQKPCVETLRLNRLLLEQAYESVFVPAPMCMPMHVVNMTLNLVGGKNLAWQDRKAESFTVSALHSGSYCVGYRDSRMYGLNNNNEAISLGTAAAISGAAASPNMGYYSSPAVTFLLTLFNVRLGWWLGNPGEAGAETFNQSGPALAARPIIAETLGMTDDQHPYVYLSDGGHFENFGLYEMVLRRCHVIVVSDGSADPQYSYEGLGNAISKVRVDLGVSIEFESYHILPHDDSDRDENVNHDQPQREHYYCAIGRIGYSQIDVREDGTRAEDGLLVYIKASLSGTEPIDIYNYARANRTFPHQSTADQMYGEAQFESYRSLGLHTLEQMLAQVASQPGQPGAPDQTFENADWRYPLDEFVFTLWSNHLRWKPEWVKDWLDDQMR